MKNLLFLTLITLILFASCQIENDDIQESLEDAELELLISKEQITSKENSSLTNPNQRAPINSEELHRNMSWIAYIALEVMKENYEAQNDFVNRIGLQETILLDDLLGNHISNESPFKSSFVERLSAYIENPNGNPCPDQIPPCSPIPTGSKPPPPLGNLDDTPGVVGDNPSPSLILSIFDGILDFKCVEIFLPFAKIDLFIPLTGGLSVAHHLQAGNEYSATAYIFGTLPPPICPFACLPNQDIYTIDSSDSFEDLESIVILMVRPRVNHRDGCLYDQYDNIEFRQFLNE